jgi:hypothetical protein
MNNKLNAKERLHLALVKSLPCSVCDASGPSEAQRRMWHIKKMDQIEALNITIMRLLSTRAENKNAF